MPKSRAFTNRISVRFCKTDCSCLVLFFADINVNIAGEPGVEETGWRNTDQYCNPQVCIDVISIKRSTSSLQMVHLPFDECSKKIIFVYI